MRKKKTNLGSSCNDCRFVVDKRERGGSLPLVVRYDTDVEVALRFRNRRVSSSRAARPHEVLTTPSQHATPASS